MRTLSAAAREALYGSSTAEVFLYLLTISHADLPTPVRLVNDLQDLVSRGNTYTRFGFYAVGLPAEQEGELPTLELRIDNIGRDLLSIVRSIATPFTVDFEVVLASQPDTVEAGPFSFSARAVDITADELTFTLAYEAYTSEPYPEGEYTPPYYPALYAAVAA